MTRKVRIRLVIAGAVLMLLGILAVWGAVESLRSASVTTKVCRCLDTENNQIQYDRPCAPASDSLIYETVCREVRHGGLQPAILVIAVFFLVLAIATTRLGLLGGGLEEGLPAQKDEYGGYEQLTTAGCAHTTRIQITMPARWYPHALLVMHESGRILVK
jgi:hypothetical protein